MDKDCHRRHQVPDGVWEYESHYLAGKVSTLDHSWTASGVGKQERNLELIMHECSSRRKVGYWSLFALTMPNPSLHAKYPFVPGVFMCINFPEVKDNIT